MKRVCIVGVGLIGGSLGLSLRRVRRRGARQYDITGTGRNRSRLINAKKRGAVDRIETNLSAAVADADIVVLCSPVQTILPLAKKIIPHMKPGAILTDVGSTKKKIVFELSGAARRSDGVQFVGAHPLAGSEKTGVENAKADLFNGAVCVITEDFASFKSLDAVRSLWRDAGARLILMKADEHDQILSMTSHLPHVMAFALFSLAAAKSKRDPRIKRLVAGSFHDMTRIAGADVSVWQGILTQNRDAVKKSINEFCRAMNVFISASPKKLENELRKITEAKKAWR